MKFKNIFAAFLFLSTITLQGQSLNFKRVEPPNWWTGMNRPFLQIMFYGDDIGSIDSLLVDYPGLRLSQVHKMTNPNYLFVDVYFTDACPAGEINFRFFNKGHETNYSYPILQRDPSLHTNMGLKANDLIYLIMPDRFANGSKRNDVVKAMRETGINRDSMYDRHGGDLQGIIDHLDYLQDLGVTALWLNPVVENDMPRTSYHGYAATDLYKVDPRLGDNEKYKELAADAHQRGMKVVMDIVHNHVGSEHWFIKDIPGPKWIHEHPYFTQSNYRASVMMDPHASKYDRKRFTDGWFVKSMPDLDQSNPYLANYLLQNNIWWIEYAGVDAFRLDTYAYSDPKFLQKWGEELLKEYPKLFSFAETWVNGVQIQSYFHGDNGLKSNFNSHLPGLTDFQLYFAITKALNESYGWTEGWSRIYYTLVADYLSGDASKNVIFLDNHDASRFFSQVGEDMHKFKMGMALLMTMRGIPCLYYGTEILMKGFSNPDGLVRSDFPGGWKKDASNKFIENGRTAKENEAFDYIRTLAQWRKNNPAIKQGQLMQYVPNDGIYVYFRYTNNRAVMVAMNSNDVVKYLDASPLGERLAGYSSGTDVLSGKKITNLGTFTLQPKSALIIDLQK